MAEKFILLWLEGPLQSWGCDSRFGRRDTLSFPTKSGVLGLILAGMGKDGEQREWLAKMSAMPLTVWDFRNQNERLPNNLMRDFQTVGNGYDSNDSWQDLKIPKTADGKKRGSILTYRFYLQDSCFGCALAVPQDDLEEIKIALTAPVWFGGLGRKSCTPSEFIFQGSFDSLDQAYERAKILASSKQKRLIRTISEGVQEGDAVLNLADVPIAFGTHKKYIERCVTIQNEIMDNG